MGPVDRTRGESGSARPGAFRALLWKEWRHHWLTVAMAAAALVLLAWGIAGADLAGMLWIPMPIIGAAACLLIGSGQFANEAASGTDRFLHALPGTRRRLWFAKFLFGATASLLLAGVAMSLHSVVWRAEAIESIEQNWWWSAWFMRRHTRTLACCLGGYTAGLFASVLVREPVKAFVTGALLLLGSVLPAALILGFAGWFAGNHNLPWVLALPWGVVCVLGLASIAAYCGKIGERSALRRFGSVAAWLAATCVLIGVLPAAKITIRYAVFPPPGDYRWVENTRPVAQRAVVIDAKDAHRSDAWLYDFSTGRLTRLTGLPGGRASTVSPDGRWVAFQSQARIPAFEGRPAFLFPRNLPGSGALHWSVVRVQNGRVVERHATPGVSGYSRALWLTHDVLAVYSRKDVRQYQVTNAGLRLNRVVNLPGRAHPLWSQMHHGTPVGRLFLRGVNGSKEELWSVDASGRLRRYPMNGSPWTGRGLNVIGPDGHLALLHSAGMEARSILFDLETRRTRELPKDFRGVGRSFSPSGRYLIGQVPNRKEDPAAAGVHIIDLKTDRTRRVKEIPANLRISRTAFSPDGREVMFLRNSKYSWDLWRVDLASARARQIKLEPRRGSVEQLHWPTPERIIITRYGHSHAGGRPLIFSMRPDGTDERQIFPPE